LERQQQWLREEAVRQRYGQIIHAIHSVTN
jgi:hypothetical protein